MHFGDVAGRSSSTEVPAEETLRECCSGSPVLLAEQVALYFRSVSSTSHRH
nr:hypothetical protein JVH1_6808 [Rhodococcus sp. JVH1]